MELLKRLALVVPTFLGVTLVAFLLIRLIPGDPVETLMGERGIDPVRHAQLQRQLGLAGPLYLQYFTYLRQLARGDLGRSIATSDSVASEFLARFPATLELSATAMVFAIVAGIPAGMLCAVKRGTVYDHAIMGASLTGYAMPIFWWGLLLILVFSVHLGWTPVSGRIGVEYDVRPVSHFLLIDAALSADRGAFRSALEHLILPAAVLGTIPLAVTARMTRSAMLEVLSQDYIRAARAKGVSRTRLLLVHALRNALIPVITVIGLQVGQLLSGAVLTETLFSWPGIGKWLVESIHRRDYPVVQGGVLLIASAIIVLNLAIDFVYRVVNPRIRHPS
jgi:dipeptide transport system permease protein